MAEIDLGRVLGKDGAPKYNLLDNSWWERRSEIVNQRGYNTYTGNQYTIDRWRTYSTDAKINVNDGNLTIAAGALMQYLDIDPYKTYTAAIKQADGTIKIATGTFSSGFGNNAIGIRCSVVDDYCRFLIESTVGAKGLLWAALYEGSYAADTLPDYVPKGYASELRECQRYYIGVSSANAHFSLQGYAYSATEARLTIPVGTQMRIAPTVTVGTIGNVNLFPGNIAPTEITGAALSLNAVTVALKASGLTQNVPLVAKINTTLSLSADL